MTGAEATTSRLASWLDGHRRGIVAVFLLATALLAAANIVLDDDTEASQEPAAAVFHARDEIDRRLPPLTHSQFVLVEAADGGDVLRAEPLAELVANLGALRAADGQGALAPDGVDPQPLLAERFDRQLQIRIDGFVSLAEVIAAGVEQRFGVPLAQADDDMVKLVAADVLAQPQTAQLANQLSVQSTRRTETVLGQSITVVESPALVFEVLAWNEPLGGGQFAIGPSADPIVHTKEDFNLRVEDTLRGNQEHISVLGVAAAANQTAEDQGATAAPFIVMAVVAAVLIVGLALRSYWATALTGVGLAFLMIWLGGISNLLGLKGGLVIDLLVPISLIALGVDFAVHSMAHYQHERRHSPRKAFRLGFGGVFSAIALAAATDSGAFLSNTSSGIESIVHFGLAAAVGTVSSFVVLGIVAPLVLSGIEDTLGPRSKTIGRFRRSSVVATLRVALMSGAASIVTLAVSPVLGAALTVVLVTVNLVVPFRYARRQGDVAMSDASASSANSAVGAASAENHQVQTVNRVIGSIVAGLAAKPIPVVLALVGITAASVYGAAGLQGSFNVADFFASDTDFVQSVERLPEHLGTTAGEPNQILIEGELTNPDAWTDIEAFIDDLKDNTALAADDSGAVVLAEPQPLEVVKLLTADPDQVEASTGTRPIDTDGNGIPDSSEQLRAVLAHAINQGVTGPSGVELFSAAEISTVLNLGTDPSLGAGSEGTENDATVLQVEIPDPSNFANLELAKEQLLQDTTSLQSSGLVDAATATGSGLGRLELVDASTDALKTSLPLAVVVVFLVLLVGFRSLRYAIVTTIPMMLVASWLYGTMALFGFDLNFVTATIGAISIGIGADYAIHMTDRYRMERQRTSSHVEATRAAAETTGVALMTSAGSTAVGFAVLSLAPMPLFATFGLLTALMVVLALLASLVALPPLLAIASRGEGRETIEAPDQSTPRDALAPA